MSKLTQKQAAQIMYAHAKALQAHEDRTHSKTMWAQWKSAEAAFAELVATLTETE
jgi:hypothetical protein